MSINYLLQLQAKWPNDHVAKDCKNLIYSRCGKRDHTSKNYTASVEEIERLEKEIFYIGL